MQNKTGSNIKFIDVSHYQASVDWSRVKKENYLAAYAKASEGIDYLDSKFSQNMYNGRAAGILMGAYHFARPEKNDAISEAKFFVSILSQYEYDLMPVLDLETPTNGPTGNITSSYIIKWARDFINYVQKHTNQRVMLYTGCWYINNFSINSLTDIPLWVARYSDTAPPNCGGWTAWTGWQYTDQGQVPGVGTCDVSVVESLDALRIQKLQTLNGSIGVLTVKSPINGYKKDGSPIIINPNAYKAYSQSLNGIMLGGNIFIPYTKDNNYVSFKKYNY